MTGTRRGVGRDREESYLTTRLTNRTKPPSQEDESLCGGSIRV